MDNNTFDTHPNPKLLKIKIWPICELVDILINMNTDIYGTTKQNEKETPRALHRKKLRKGGIIGSQGKSMHFQVEKQEKCDNSLINP